MPHRDAHQTVMAADQHHDADHKTAAKREKSQLSALFTVIFSGKPLPVSIQPHDTFCFILD